MSDKQYKPKGNVGYVGVRKTKHPKHKYKYKEGGMYEVYLKYNSRYPN